MLNSDLKLNKELNVILELTTLYITNGTFDLLNSMYWAEQHNTWQNIT